LKNYFIEVDEEIKLKYKGICTYHENNFVSHPIFWYDVIVLIILISWLEAFWLELRNHEIYGGFDL
jgi:hypothetical protein